MRLVVQIPCYNEQDTIGAVIADIPRVIPGISDVLVVVVDDGSSDQTVPVAVAAGADYIARHVRNRGLAAAFQTGLDAAVRLGADIVVNTDGDHQYHGQDIPRLVEPILRGKADFVVGDRDAAASPHFSLQKRFLQGAGSRIVRQLSGTGVPDAPSGFRALSRDAALRLNVVTSYSYTIETLIQAGTQKMAVVSIPIATRSTPRKSRLARGSIDYVLRSAVTVVRAYAMYQPLRLFVMSALLLVIPGLIGALRFVWFYAQGNGSGHVQSLVLSGVLIIIGFQVGLIGLVADLIAANRRLIEESLYRLRRIDARRDPLRPLDDADQPEPIPDEKRSNTHV